MAPPALPFALRVASRRITRRGVTALSQPVWSRCLSTKHPKGFVPPTAEELTELRERVQDFTRE